MHTAVHRKARTFIVETWQSQANLSLFLVLLAITVFVLPALPVKTERIALYGNVVYSLILMSGVAIASGRRRLLVAAICAALPALAMRWAAWLRANYATLIWAEAFSLLAVVVIAWVLLAQVFRGGAIDMARVQGAVAVYLLLGAAYAFAYQIDWFANPAAFDSSEGPVKSFVDWIYFSFCTLSTLGYGDIVPTSRMSRRSGKPSLGRCTCLLSRAWWLCKSAELRKQTAQAETVEPTVNPVRQLHPLWCNT